MNRSSRRFRGAALLVALILGVISLGCSDKDEGQTTKGKTSSEKRAGQPAANAKPGHTKPSSHSEPLVPPTAKQLGPHVYFERIAEGDRRRVYVEAAVCLREGEYGLEFLLCRKPSKEHESVLHTEADARIIHLGLEAAGAVDGAPVKFDPEFKSPTGTPIRVTVRYADQGKVVSRPAQDWVRNVKTKEALAENWVFAGSEFFTDPDDPTKKPIYLATAEGSYISVANVPTAMLDLPINSPKQLEGREFAPFTERIPPVDTRVVLMLEPVRKPKK